MTSGAPALPLAGVRVLERASGAAAAYGARMLAVLGAEVLMLEPPGGTPLRREAPFLDAHGTSALFAYLAAGKGSVVWAGAHGDKLVELDALLASTTILIDDTPVRERPGQGLDPQRVAERHPNVVYVSVLPFGAFGPKAEWMGEELNLVHAGGEGNLLPNGLTLELFPDREPLKMHGNFMSYQAGVTAALGALAAHWAGIPGQFVDVSIQDVVVALGCMALQSFGDGVVEHRKNRSFRYGGVFECADGYVEAIPVEHRHWQALYELLGKPAWMDDPAFADEVERGKRGREINEHLRTWIRTQATDELVERGQTLGLPIAKYNTPADILGGAQERARNLFAPVDLGTLGEVPMFVAPMRFGEDRFDISSGPPALGSHQQLLTEACRDSAA